MPDPSQWARDRVDTFKCRVGARQFVPDSFRLKLAREFDTLRVAVLEIAAQRLLAFAAYYPTDVFVPPPHGQHAATVDGCSAHALRVMLPILADVVRKDDDEERHGGAPQGGSGG